MTTVTTGNTILAPPRLAGDYTKDYQVLQRWLSDVYDQIAKAANLIGTQADLQKRVAALEAGNVTILVRLNSLDGL